MKTALLRIGAAMYMMLAIMGFYAVTGAPVPRKNQIASAVISAIAVHVYMEVVRRRRRPLAG